MLAKGENGMSHSCKNAADAARDTIEKITVAGSEFPHFLMSPFSTKQHYSSPALLQS